VAAAGTTVATEVGVDVDIDAGIDAEPIGRRDEGGR
jgi:hypothetical protein